MKLPLQVTYRNMQPTPAIERAIREKVAKLESLYPRIIACRVTVEAPANHQSGGHFQVSVDVTLPGAELVADRSPAERAEHEDFHVALRDAFRAIRRELDKYVSKRQQRRVAPRQARA